MLDRRNHEIVDFHEGHPFCRFPWIKSFLSNVNKKKRQIELISLPLLDRRNHEIVDFHEGHPTVV